VADHAADKVLGLATVGQVGVEEGHLGACFAHASVRPLGTAGRAVVVHRHARAGGSRLDCHLGAYAPAGAGDEHDSVGQVIGHQSRSAASSAARTAPAVSAPTGWSGGRMTVLSITPSSLRATFVRAR
jgi:hypothetical protein